MDGHTYAVRSAFPYWATPQTVTRLFAGGEMQPGDAPVVTAVRGEDTFAFRMEYAIAAADLQADLRAQVLEGLPTEPPAGGGAGRGIGSAVRPASAGVAAEDGPSVIGAITDGVLSQGAEQVLEGWTDKVAGKKGSTTFKALANGKKVWEALELNEAVAKAMARVVAAKECARNPTNPLTKQAWKDNPADQQAVLDRISQIQDEITGNTAVIFTTMLADVGGGFVEAAPWLGYVTGSAVNYVKDTLTSIMDDLVREAEAMVPACAPPAYKAFEQLPMGMSVRGSICSLTEPFTVQWRGDYTGQLTFTPSSKDGGNYVFKARGPAGISLRGGGPYTVVYDETGQAASLDFDFVTTLTVPNVSSETTSEFWSLKLTPTAPCTRQ